MLALVLTLEKTQGTVGGQCEAAVYKPESPHQKLNKLVP